MQFLKDYGALIGPIVAVLTIYIKWFIDAYFLKKNSEKQILKVVKLIKTYPPPEWLTTYEVTDKININDAAKSRNLYNLMKFYRIIISVKSLIDEIIKDIYKNSSEKEIILISNIRERCQTIIEKINIYNSEFERLGAAYKIEDKIHKDNLRHNPNTPIHEALKKIDNELDNHLLFTNILFMEIKFFYEHIVEIIDDENSIFNTSIYDYDLSEKN